MKNRLKSALVEMLVLSIVAGVILGAGWSFAKRTEARKSYTPTNLIRLHIIGNSDTPQDQEVKLKVRDAILSTFGADLISAQDREDAEKILQSKISEIQKVATQCLKDNGFNYEARARLTTAFFPDRLYETQDSSQVFLPQGYYRALQIILGDGNGANWWCIMYPSLCYFDLIKPADSETLKSIVSSIEQDVAGTGNVSQREQQTLAVLLDDLSTEKVPVEIRSFFLDMLKEGAKTLHSILPRWFFSLGRPSSSK